MLGSITLFMLALTNCILLILWLTKSLSLPFLKYFFSFFFNSKVLY